MEAPKLKLRVAALQMVSAIDVAANCATAGMLLSNARDQGAHIAVLPEYWCAMVRHDHERLLIAEPFGAGALQDFLQQQAQHLNLYVVGGSIPLQSSDPTKVTNTTLVYAPDGRCIARYDKVHLFCFDNGHESYQESRAIIAGSQPSQFECMGWQIGLSICYDLRFPEFFRLPTHAICTAWLLPAAFTRTTGQAHWEILLRARAIENQSFFIAAAQGGEHENGRSTFGHSMLIDPWGRILAQLDSGPGVVCHDCDPNVITQVRAQLPAWQHRVF